MCIAHDPGTRLRDIAARLDIAVRLDITERSAHGIITDLTAAGYLVKQKDGRRNRYQIQAHLPLPEPASRERTVGEVLALLTGNDRPGIELPPASDANGRRATQAELKTPLMPGRHGRWHSPQPSRKERNTYSGKRVAGQDSAVCQQ